MGKRNRSPRRLVVEDTVEVVEEPTVNTNVVPVEKPRPVQNPNSAGGLLNSILTTLLTQEYNRLQQQLLNIKQQLDAQKFVTDSIVDVEPIDKKPEIKDNESNEAKLLSVSASQQETSE